MRDSDTDDDFQEFIFQTTNLSQEKQIVLDPAVTLRQRQKRAELAAKVAELEQKAASQQTTEIEPLESNSPEPTVEEIKYIHPGHIAFNENGSCCIFTKECLKIKKFIQTQGVNYLCEIEDSHIHTEIRKKRVKVIDYHDGVANCFCLYMFFLASVHDDDTIVHNVPELISSIKKDWFPSVSSIFTVLINWGIRSELLDIKDLEPDHSIPFDITKKFQGEPRKWDYNMRKVLELIDCTAQGIASEEDESKLNKLIYVLVYSALDPGAELYLYSRCICSILDNIPENKWNKDRELTVARLLFQNGTEDHHNLAAVCLSILNQGSRALMVARALACMLLNHLMANGKDGASLDMVSCQNIFQLLGHHKRIYELQPYHLYYTLRLLNFCVQMDYIQEKLSAAHLRFLTTWLRNVGGCIITNVESVDWNNLKESISRYIICWGIMLTDTNELKMQSIRSISPLTDDSIEADEETEEQECGNIVVS